MKNIILQITLFSFVNLLSNAVFGQLNPYKIPTSGNQHKTFHYESNGEAKIKYFAFDNAIIRQEENVYTLLDENMQKKDVLKIPEEGEKIAYTIYQDDNFLYIIQKAEFTISKKEINYKWMLHRMKVSDFSNLETYELKSRRAFNFIKFYPNKGNGILTFQFGHKITDVQNITPEPVAPVVIDLKQFEVTDCEDGDWSRPDFTKVDLRFFCVKRNDENRSTMQEVYFDENFNVIRQLVHRTNLETNKRITTDENGDETIVELQGSIKVRDIKPVPYAVNVNGEDIWIKTTYRTKGYSTKIEATWISRDTANGYLNLTEHLKKEMKAVGVNKSTGMNAPIIYADPINNSIVVQYWLVNDVEINGMGKTIQSFVYFNLDSQFNLRATYKVKMNRYPIADHRQQQAVQLINQIFGFTQNIAFEINKNPRKWDGETTGTSQNAFDFLFSQNMVNGLCTIINVNNAQYLFIDQENGSSTGYIFKK